MNCLFVAHLTTLSIDKVTGR